MGLSSAANNDGTAPRFELLLCRIILIEPLRGSNSYASSLVRIDGTAPRLVNTINNHKKEPQSGSIIAGINVSKKNMNRGAVPSMLV
jgi:hypothetical protein